MASAKAGVFNENSEIVLSVLDGFVNLYTRVKA